MIPDSITREHILKAIEEIKSSEIRTRRDSDKYDLEYDNSLYPPKFVISMANKYANGKELDSRIFGGGNGVNNFLKSRGFNIVDKEPETDLEQQEHDFAPRLRDYLENIYSIRLEKSTGRAHLTFPSGAIINVRGSKILKEGRGFYHLQEDEYKELVNYPNRYFAVVFGNKKNISKRKWRWFEELRQERERDISIEMSSQDLEARARFTFAATTAAHAEESGTA